VYETDTKPGSSGSPVLNDRWQLVVLHHASEPARDADGVEIDVNGRRVTRSTPEYLRQWVANA
jgi:endonuclease G